MPAIFDGHTTLIDAPLWWIARNKMRSRASRPLLKAALIIMLALALSPLRSAQANDGSKPAACEDITPLIRRGS